MVDFAENAWAFRGQDGLDRSHVPAQPLWVAGLRVGQLVVGFIVFVLTAYAAGQLDYSGLAGFGLTWFTYIWTLGYFAYLLVAIIYKPAFYNYWAHLGLEALTVIWWLCTWAVLASNSTAWGWISSRYIPSRYKTAVDCIKASAGLGALVWLLFLATSAFLVLSVLNHRKAGGGQAPTSSAPMTNIPPGGPEGQYGQSPPQQPGYPQQAYQQPQQAYQQPPMEGYPQGQYPMQQQSPMQQQPPMEQQPPMQQDVHEAPAQNVSPYQQQSPYSPPQQAPYSPPQQTPYPQQ